MNRDLGADHSAAELERILREEPPTSPTSISVTRTLRRTIVDYAKLIREAIDTVDPSMRCGICACWGGYWENGDIAHALAGTRTKPFMRVNDAAYGDQRPTTFVNDIAIASRVIYQLDGVDEILDETDTFPQNYMSESAVMFHSHITHAMLSGLAGCKLWTSEFQQPVHTGSQRRYEARLRDYAGFYEALHDLAPAIRWQGISGHVGRPPEGYGGHPIHTERGLHPGPWCTAIEAVYGFPLRYQGVETGGVFALRGENIDVMDDAQVEAFLSRRTIVDSFAARKLTARGFAPLLGVEATEGGDDFHFTFEMVVESGEQEFVRHGLLPDGRELLSVTRLSYDTDETLPLRLKRDPKMVERLSPKGKWEPVPFRRTGPLLVEVDVHVACCDTVVLRFAF